MISISNTIDYMRRLVAFNRTADPDWEPTRHTFDGIRGTRAARGKRTVLHTVRALAKRDGDTEELRTLRDNLIRFHHQAGGRIGIQLDIEARFRRQHPIAVAESAEERAARWYDPEAAFEDRAVAFREAQQKLLVRA
ncbi:hypothetical protein [Rhodococcus sp. RS1C4]|nr:hypothetical protein [Rhodococcus sp. RS1C4]